MGLDSLSFCIRSPRNSLPHALRIEQNNGFVRELVVATSGMHAVNKTSLNVTKLLTMT